METGNINRCVSATTKVLRAGSKKRSEDETEDG